MKDDQWIWIGVAAGAAYLIYKSTKPITNTLDAVGGGVGDAVGGVGGGIGLIGSSTGENYDQIADSFGKTVADNISLFNVKQDLANLYGFLQDKFNNNITQQPNQSTLSVKPVGNVNFNPNVSNANKNIISIVAPKTQTLTPMIDSIIQKPLTQQPSQTLYGPRLITPTATTRTVKIGLLTI